VSEQVCGVSEERVRPEVIGLARRILQRLQVLILGRKVAGRMLVCHKTDRHPVSKRPPREHVAYLAQLADRECGGGAHHLAIPGVRREFLRALAVSDPSRFAALVAGAPELLCLFLPRV
jgi:hypothetical protein